MNFLSGLKKIILGASMSAGLTACFTTFHVAPKPVPTYSCDTLPYSILCVRTFDDADLSYHSGFSEGRKVCNLQVNFHNDNWFRFVNVDCDKTVENCLGTLTGVIDQYFRSDDKKVFEYIDLLYELLKSKAISNNLIDEEINELIKNIEYGLKNEDRSFRSDKEEMFEEDGASYNVIENEECLPPKDK